MTLARLPRVLRVLARWGGLAAIVGFYALAPLDIVYPGWVAVVPTAGAALVVVAGLPRSPAVKEVVRDPVLMVLRTPVSQRIGRYSYGWYLWHWPPIVLLPLVLGHRLTWWELIGVGVASLLAAVASYHLLEHPIRTSRGLATRHGRLSLALGLVLIVSSTSTAQLVGARAEHVVTSTRIATPRGAVLMPSVAAADSETLPAIDRGCLLPATAPGNARECRYLPDRGHGDVILIGDSHAAMYLPALWSAGREEGWGLRVWTRENCPFADVVKHNHDDGRACQSWRSNAIARIIAARPSLVVVASYPPPGGPALRRPGSAKFVSGAAARPIYRAGMIANLQRLQRAGIAVLLLADVPRFDVSAPTCVIDNPGHLAACSAPRAVADHAPIDVSAARAVPETHVVDFDDVFCRGARCFQVIGSTIAYLDNNHLTKEMVSRLTPRITVAMEQAMR